MWGDWGERADWQRCKGPNRQHLRWTARERTCRRACVVAVRVPAIHSIQALCLSVASFSLNNDISRFSRSSLTTASVSLTKLSRSFPPATLFDFLACLPAYNLIHSAAHDSTVSPRAHHHHHYHQHPPPPALPTAHETLRLLQSTASLSSQSGNTTPPTLQHEPARAPLNVELAGSQDILHTAQCRPCDRGSTHSRHCLLRRRKPPAPHPDSEVLPKVRPWSRCVASIVLLHSATDRGLETSNSDR